MVETVTGTTGEQPNINGFWAWFADKHLEILEIMGGRREGRVTEMLDRALDANGLHLAYEVTEGIFGGELTFTPEGDAELGRFIDRFAAAAPSFETWVVFSRVQRKPLSTAVAIVQALHGVDVGDARFKFVWLEERYHLCFLHDVLFGLPEDQRYEIVSTFLDHALGEEVVMEHIGQIEFKRSGEGVAMPLLINEIIRQTSDGLTGEMEGTEPDLRRAFQRARGGG